jgi:DNA-binding response OmpR family regulator
MKVLLIEDEPGLSEALCHALKIQNYDATACLDGESGLDEALTGLYDAIILDIMLPKKNGFEVLRQLRSEKISTPVLMLTAYSELESRVKGLDAGADYYLTKPFQMAELMACLRAITRRPNKIEEESPEYGDLQLEMRHGGVSGRTARQFINYLLGVEE